MDRDGIKVIVAVEITDSGKLWKNLRIFSVKIYFLNLQIFERLEFFNLSHLR